MILVVACWKFKWFSVFKLECWNFAWKLIWPTYIQGWRLRGIFVILTYVSAKPSWILKVGFFWYLFTENVHKYSTSKHLHSLYSNSQKIFLNPQTSTRHNHHTIWFPISKRKPHMSRISRIHVHCQGLSKRVSRWRWMKMLKQVWHLWFHQIV